MSKFMRGFAVFSAIWLLGNLAVANPSVQDTVWGIVESPLFTGGTLTSALLVQDSGTNCSAPGLGIAGKTTTGLDSSAAATLSLCAGGTEAAKLATTGLTIPLTGAALTIGAGSDIVPIGVVANDGTLGDYLQIDITNLASPALYTVATGFATKSAGGYTAALTTSGPFFGSGTSFKFSNSTAAFGTTDTTLSRNAAGFLQVGTTASNASGSIMFDIAESDLADAATTCTQGRWYIDTGGATVELCYCRATDSIACAPLTVGNPVD